MRFVTVLCVSQAVYSATYGHFFFTYESICGQVADLARTRPAPLDALSYRRFGGIAWLQTSHRPVFFAPLSSAVFFAWGEIFSLFPSITADLYGRKWATTNYGLVYTTKAAIFAAAFLGLFALKPLAKRTIAQEDLLEQKQKAAAEQHLVVHA